MKDAKLSIPKKQIARQEKYNKKEKIQ